jgi:hypothetical protein
LIESISKVIKHYTKKQWLIGAKNVTEESVVETDLLTLRKIDRRDMPQSKNRREMLDVD